jgi:hypothetical protein
MSFSLLNRTVVVVLVLASARLARAGVLDGVGAMGDSAVDEYQFYNADPGDRSFARNFVEQLATLRNINFGSFTTADRGSPRDQGYEYNWARTRTTAAANFTLGPGADFPPLTSLGQQTGLAGQVAAHQVTLALVLVGSNDYLQYFIPGSGANPANLPTQATGMLANITSACDTVMNADPNVKMVIATIPDEKRSPAALGAIQQAIAANLITPTQADQLLAGITASINAYNAGLVAYANEAQWNGRIAIADAHGLVESMAGSNPTQFGPYELDMNAAGTDPNDFWLADGIHPGTVAQTLLANLFLDTINSHFGTDVPDITPAEIQGVGQLPAVPEPASLLLLLPAAGLLMRRRRLVWRC